MTKRAATLAATALVFSLSGGLVACSGSSQEPWTLKGQQPQSVPGSDSPSSAPATNDASATVSVIAVGDSLATGDGHDSVPSDPGSWTMYLGDRIDVVGGWRRDGANTQLMADNMADSRADLLVIMAGTNDIGQGLPLEATLDNLRRIRDKATVKAVVLAAIPPQADSPERVTSFNESIRNLATESGWTWVDPWASVRGASGWTEGSSIDGVHPLTPAYRAAGSSIAATVIRLMGVNVLPSTRPDLGHR
jgi:lysophospholipase L1-like esterase